MKLLATLAFAALCIASATAAPANFTEWVGHQRRNFNPDGKGAAAGLFGPAGLVTDGKTVYLAEIYNHAPRNITLEGVATTMVGGVIDGSGANVGYWNETSLSNPHCIAMSWDNTTLYIGGSHGVSAIDIATSNSSRKYPVQYVYGVAYDANNTLWVADSTQISALWRANDFGVNRHNLHLQFGGFSSGVSDGIGRDAQFGTIGDIAIHYPEPSDLLKTIIIVVDNGAHTIRGAHTGNMSVFTIAGVAGSASFQDGPRGIGMLASPGAIAIPRRGMAKHAYVAMRSVIRRVDIVSGELTTILGKWNAQGLVYSVNPWQTAFGDVAGLMEFDNKLFISLASYNTIATLELNATATFAVSAAVSPATGVVAIAAALVASLLL